MSFFKKKSQSFTSKPNTDGCCELPAGGGETQLFAFTDPGGHPYGTSFETISSEYSELGGAFTQEGFGTYYRDANTDTYYEDFVINVNSVQLGGDWSTFIPIYLKILNDVANDSIHKFIMGQSETELSVTDILQTIGSNIQIQSNSTYISTYDTITNLYTGLTSGNTFAEIYVNNSTSGADNRMTVQDELLNIYSQNTVVPDVETGFKIDAIIPGGAARITEMYTDIPSTVSTGWIRIISDPTDILQPLRFNIRGLQAYANAGAAAAAGLQSNDLFLIGTALNVVP